MIKKEKKCEELECIVVDLDSRVKEFIMTLQARECELESIVVALDTRRKELLSAIAAKREELEFRISEICQSSAGFS